MTPPKVIFINESRVEGTPYMGTVAIECPYIPAHGLNDEQAAELLAANVCRNGCGFYRDVQVRKLRMMCFNPSSPYLVEIKKQLQ